MYDQTKKTTKNHTQKRQKYQLLAMRKDFFQNTGLNF